MINASNITDIFYISNNFIHQGKFAVKYIRKTNKSTNQQKPRTCKSTKKNTYKCQYFQVFLFGLSTFFYIKEFKCQSKDESVGFLSLFLRQKGNGRTMHASTSSWDINMLRQNSLIIGITAWLSILNYVIILRMILVSFGRVVRLADIAEDVTLPQITSSFIVGSVYRSRGDILRVRCAIVQLNDGCVISTTLL